MILTFSKSSGQNENQHDTVEAFVWLYSKMPLSMQVVPESQMSLGESEKSAASYLLPAPPAPVQEKEVCTQSS